MTNADRIRSMTDEELAEFLESHTNCFGNDLTCKKFCGRGCTEAWLMWLRQEVNDEV